LKTLVVACAAVCTLAAQDSGNIVVRVGTLIDGKGNVARNQDIVISGSKIQDVRPAKGSATYDLRKLTIMPGWIDTHVHLDWHFDREHKLANRNNEKPEETVLYEAENAWVTLLGGFTTVQCVGSRTDVPVRDRINEGTLPGPRILTSVRQITNQSGEPDKLRELVRQTKKDGADLIKLFATSGMGAGGGQTMTDAQIQATCGEANDQGMRSLVHAIGAAGAKAAILAGCTSIEHGSYIDDEDLDLMVKRGTYFDPNFLVIHNYLDNRSGFPTFTPQSFESLEKALAPTADILKRARARHVKVVFGTDAVAGAHGRNAEEFIYRVKDAGDKPMDAMVSATSMAAASLGLADKIGSIAKGMEADLVATEGNPLDDITAVRRVVFVMKGGRVYKNITYPGTR